MNTPAPSFLIGSSSFLSNEDMREIFDEFEFRQDHAYQTIEFLTAG